jgi:endonuclease/exonuclease/phosphatase family metal-dependent hydrolase
MKHNLMNHRTLLTALCATLILALATGCAGCNISPAQDKAPAGGNTIAILTWNIQTLFDGVDEGTEYDDYREQAGWTVEKYRGRLTVIAGAIGALERKPDIIAVQEVESAQVVADLAVALGGGGSSQGFWTHFATIPGMSLGLGLLSRLPLEGAKAHSVYVDGEIAPRPMLEARVMAENGPLALFVCHWKSKLGGDEATEGARRASARIIVRRLREMAEHEPDLPAIVMGDLNENHDEFYRRSGTVISALLPDDPRAAAMVAGLQTDYIVVSKSKPPQARYFPAPAVTLYSPWAVEMEDGSYYYRNEWETIDHFLLSPQLFDGTGWDFANCQVINHPPYASVNGRPTAYNPRTGGGLSDHLPLMLFLERRE